MSEYMGSDAWLRDSLADIFINKEQIQTESLLERYETSKKYTKEQYLPNRIEGILQDGEEFLLKPFMDLTEGSGVLCQLKTQKGGRLFTIKGSLLATQNIENFTDQQQDSIGFLSRSLDETFSIQPLSVDGESFLGINGLIVEGGYLVINQIWMVNDEIEQGMQDGRIDMASYNLRKIIAKSGASKTFLHQIAPELYPIILQSISLIDNSNKQIST